MAKSRSIGSIYASLSLRDASFKKGLAAAGKQLKGYAAASAKYAAVGGVALGTAMATGLAVGVKKTVEMAGTLDDLSATTGVAIADAMRMRKAYELGGASVEGVGKDIGKMQKAIVAAASGGADPFKDIGLSAAELLKMDPAAQFKEIGASIMRISNPAERTAKAMEIFGKSGAALTNVFGQFEDADKFLGRMPQVFQQYGASMARADDLMNELPNKGQQFLTGFTSGIIGQLLPALEKTAAFDFVDIGQNLGRHLSMAFIGIKDGTYFEIFALKATGTVMQLAEDIGKTLAAGISAGLDMGVKKFEHFGAFMGDFWIGTSGGNSILDGWMDSKNKGVLDRAAAQGYSPLGGGPPAAGEKTFDERFAEYLKNQKGDGIGAEMFDIAADLEERLKNKFEAAQAAAAVKAGEAGQDPIADPIEDLAAKAAAAAAKAPAKIEVNEYQRRGLSLGGGVATKEDKQISLLEQIVVGIKMINEPGKRALVYP